MAKRYCAKCQKETVVVDRRITFQLEDKEIPNVLALFCTECNTMCALPHQAIAEIREGRKPNA